MRVLIADNVSRSCELVLQERGIEVERAAGVPRERLLELLPGFDGMFVRSAVTVDREMIEGMSTVRAIGRAGAGVDNIDIVASTERGIVVMNTPDGNTISAAEHSVAMLLALLRKIPAANASLRGEAWDRKSFTGTELWGKRVGVLGLGRIGREVAARIQSFKSIVMGYDPYLSADAVRGLGIVPATFEELLENSDILTIHIPLSPQTRGLLGDLELGRMKKGVFIVNCARGGIVDERALLAGLESGRIAGAALDVFEQEPPRFPNALISHPRVVATPHIAASTEEAQERVAHDIAVQMADFFEGMGARGVVNAEGLESSSFLRESIPLMNAAERLGALLGQLVGEKGCDCRLIAYGSDAAQIVRGLGASFLAGLVSQGSDRTVNPINAEMLARRNDIRLTTSGEGAHPDYNGLLLAEASRGDLHRRAAVTVFGRDQTRLVMLDDVWLDVRPIGTLIVFKNIDKPGVLSEMSGVLGRHGVNIADMSLGQREGTGEALTVMRIDGDVGPDVIADLCALDVVSDVRTLHFDVE